MFDPFVHSQETWKGKMDLNSWGSWEEKTEGNNKPEGEGLVKRRNEDGPNDDKSEVSADDSLRKSTRRWVREREGS
jgi:hypothetical protein